MGMAALRELQDGRRFSLPRSHQNLAMIAVTMPVRSARMIHGLSHMTFIVADLDRSERLLVEGLGARKVYDSGARSFSLAPERFFLLGDGRAPLWIAIMCGPGLPERGYSHIAFKIDAGDLETYRTRILALGLDIREGRARVEGEGHSLYFHDFDNHLFELHTGTLAQRLASYAALSITEETSRPETLC
jgi:catechol 2,3-dioxygenase-like lactoylglutathione lyase family enzyme